MSGNQTPTQPHTAQPTKRRFPLLPVLVGLAALVVLALRSTTSHPMPIGQAAATPTSVQRLGGAWYWLEQTKTGGNLVRATRVGRRILAMAETLPRYAVAEGRLAWTLRQEGHWSIVLASADGSGAHTLFQGPDEPLGLMLSGDHLYWLRHAPPPVPNGDPFPPLSGSLEILTLPCSGGPVASLGHLAESEDATILGLHANGLYIAAYRHGTPGILCLYRATLDGAPPVRLVGESGLSNALLTHDGTLYWLAPSLEALNAYRLRRLTDSASGAENKIETLSDWLPGGGTLFETAQGVLYEDHESLPSLWPAGRQDRFPMPVPVPNGYVPLAAGDREMLLASFDRSYSTPNLAWSPLP